MFNPNNMTPYQFNSEQIKGIIDKIVPIIAAPEDHEFFRGVLFVKAETCKSSSEFSYFISKLFKVNP